MLEKPLIRKILRNPVVKGIGGWAEEIYKVSAFADDILLSLTSPLNLLPSVMSDIAVLIIFKFQNKFG